MTRQTLDDTATTIEEAVAFGVKVCAHPALENELTTTWPAANFFFDQSGNDEIGLVNAYENQKCQALAIST